MVPEEFIAALDDVRPRLGRLATSVAYFETIGSTNDAAAAKSEGAVVVAGAQTQGRGRRGRNWFSPPGSGLYVSVVLAPGLSVDPRRALSLTTIAAGVAIADGIERATRLSARLKWPNDLYVGGRKLAGILAEGSGSVERVVVLGYGINIGDAAFPAELLDRATSLESALGVPPPRARVLAETLAALAERYDDLLAGRFDAILNGWRGRADASGARVEWTAPEGPRSGDVVDIDADGALLVRIDGVGSVERIVGGELKWT